MLQKNLDWKDSEQLKRAVADIQNSVNAAPGGFQSFGGPGSGGMGGMQVRYC